MGQGLTGGLLEVSEQVPVLGGSGFETLIDLNGEMEHNITIKDSICEDLQNLNICLLKLITDW